jgi:hypothetical protein
MAVLRHVVQIETRNSRNIKGKRVAIVQGPLRIYWQTRSEYGGCGRSISDSRYRILKVLNEMR